MVVKATFSRQYFSNFVIFPLFAVGGRMIGKQMGALLLDKKTLEFYKVLKLKVCS